MGNLRGNCTDQEWEEMEAEIKEEKKNGKPRENYAHLNLSNQDIETLKGLKNVLSKFYTESDLFLIDKWIKYNELCCG